MDSKCLKAIADGDPAHGHNKHLEVVIGTWVINGGYGPPSILAVQSW
jgi:hypothetical protein